MIPASLPLSKNRRQTVTPGWMSCELAWVCANMNPSKDANEKRILVYAGHALHRRLNVICIDQRLIGSSPAALTMHTALLFYSRAPCSHPKPHAISHGTISVSKVQPCELLRTLWRILYRQCLAQLAWRRSMPTVERSLRFS